MPAEHSESNEPSPEKQVQVTGDKARDQEVTDELSDVPNEDQLSAPPDKSRMLVNRPALGDLAKLGAFDRYKNQFSAAEQMRKFMSGTATEQMRKAMGDSIAEQMQNIVRDSLGEQMRQIEQAIRPLNTIQDTIGRIARDAEGGQMRHLFEEQASRHREMMEALRPRWDQTLAGSALAESLRSIRSFQCIHQAELLQTQNAIREQFSSIGSLLEALRPKLPSLTEISDFWLRYPARVKENLVALAEAGCYLDPEMDMHEIVHFKEDLENGTVEEVNDELALHFQSSLARIEEALCTNHPARALLIREAFDAHHEGKYSLSIPALFAQADGICYDLTGQQIFAGKGISRLAKRIDPETLERAYLEPLLRAIPITESSRQRRAKIPQLNRHAVMHGESTNFASQQNGLKAISFIHFVSHVLGMAVAWKTDIVAPPESGEPPTSLG